MAEKNTDAKLKQGKKLKEQPQKEYDYSSYDSEESPVRKPMPKIKQKKERPQNELVSKSEKQQHKEPEPVEEEYSSFEDSDGSPAPTKEQQTDGIDEPNDASRRRTTRRRSMAKRGGGTTRSRSRRSGRARKSSRSKRRRS